MKIPVAKPLLTDKERNNLINAFDSGWISKGKYIEEFEEKISNYFGFKNTICVSNGSAALEMAIRALEVENQKILNIVSSCVSSANSIIHSFNEPFFCDVNENTFQMDIDSFYKTIRENNIKIIVITHLYGSCCDMDKITDIAQELKLKVIEDCSQSMGAKYNSKLLGTYGDVSMFSFYVNKIITTGEGGAVITNNDKLGERLGILRNQGQIAPFKSKYFGNNYKMSNLLAAIGSAQMDNIDNFIQKRRENAQFIRQNLIKNDNLIFPKEDDRIFNVFFCFPIFIRNKNKLKVVSYLENNGIETRPLFQPLPTQEYFKRLYPEYNKEFPVAQKLYENGFYVSCSPTLTKDDLNYLVEKIELGIANVR